MKTTAIYTILVLVLFTFSCKKDDNKQDLPDLSSQGVYIVNEGAFGAGNSSLTFLNLQYNTVHNNVFENINGFPLGDLTQSATIHQSKLYLVVNGSQKIEVVDAMNLNSVATISGFAGPRYMAARGNKGYVSDWFANEIKVVDLINNNIVNSVPTGSGPEQLLIAGNLLFVVNVGGWDSDSTVTIINLETETVATTIPVGVNPNSIQLDANGKLWILCGGSTGPDFVGGTADDIAGSLWKINPLTFAVEAQWQTLSSQHPSKLQLNGSATELYFLAGTDGYTGKIMRLPVSATALPVQPLTQKEFYGLGIDPVSGIIYAGFVPGFTQNGSVFRFDVNFNLLDSATTGIAPNYFVFR